MVKKLPGHKNRKLEENLTEKLLFIHFKKKNVLINNVYIENIKGKYLSFQLGLHKETYYFL